MTLMLTTAETTPFNATPAPDGAVKGWHRDPHGRHDLRYHDGSGWSDHVTHFGPVPCTGCAAARS